ncbi:hypothetical protein GOBAR_DD22268 [Gossypium barbadense]|nr:hypothetical protein GOBAR_DD22268 [Gossypium barbadense]
MVMLLDENNLEGTIPMCIGNLSSSLIAVQLGNNNFHGQIPENFAKGCMLRSLRIDNNKLEGSLPRSLGNCKGLNLLNVGNNNLNDTFPSWLGNLDQLQVLTLSNQFRGEIPKILGELHLLIVLNLSYNCLIGPIPSSLGNLSELESLDLSSNKLERRIPTELKNLGFLEVLNLSQNNLKGPIPQGKQFDTFTNDSYMGNLDLCGLPLSKNCGTDEETPAIFDRDDDGDELNWKFSILMGYGCGLVLGMSMAYIVFTTGKPWWLIRIVERKGGGEGRTRGNGDSSSGGSGKKRKKSKIIKQYRDKLTTRSGCTESPLTTTSRSLALSFSLKRSFSIITEFGFSNHPRPDSNVQFQNFPSNPALPNQFHRLFQRGFGSEMLQHQLPSRDIASTSDFGHITLPRNGSDSISDSVHTVFDNCKNLSDNYRVRWNLNVEENWIKIGLEAAAPTTYYMAFGWANPNRTKELMSKADVTVASFTEEGRPFVDDFYITAYSECKLSSKDQTAIGVCPDVVYENSKNGMMVNNTRLVYGHRRDGVSLIMFRKPLNSTDKKYDLPVYPKLMLRWQVLLRKKVDDCFGPLDADDNEDQELIIVDTEVPLVATTGEVLHYPNPPSPSKAGHDVALYITSDSLGGNAILRNATETIYSGGPEAEGVVANPHELIWVPDRNTPDQVYYQSLYQEKMGWKVQVFDGALTSVLLDDQVTFFWTLSEDSITIAAHGVNKSGYLAIGFGNGMVNSYAYVGWIGDTGKGHLNTYWIDGKHPLNIHPTNENLTHVRCRSEDGIITLEFRRPLKPSCNQNDKPECKNIVDPTTPLKVIWAMGSKWTDEHLSEKYMHTVTSQRPVYLKHVKGDGWYQIHIYLQYSGLAIILLGVLFAVAELRGFYVSSIHVKLGIAAIVFASLQPMNAYLRPEKPANREDASTKRLIWEYFHVIIGRVAITVGIAALFTGMKHLGERYRVENVHDLSWVLIIWFLIAALTCKSRLNGKIQFEYKFTSSYIIFIKIKRKVDPPTSKIFVQQ